MLRVFGPGVEAANDLERKDDDKPGVDETDKGDYSDRKPARDDCRRVYVVHVSRAGPVPAAGHTGR